MKEKGKEKIILYLNCSHISVLLQNHIALSIFKISFALIFTNQF
jgi:hypothetical protein